MKTEPTIIPQLEENIRSHFQETWPKVFVEVGNQRRYRRRFDAKLYLYPNLSTPLSEEEVGDILDGLVGKIPGFLICRDVQKKRNPETEFDCFECDIEFAGKREK